MDTIWVLIVLAHAGFSAVTGNAVTTAEFTSKVRCEEAGRLIKDKAATEPKSKKLVTFICTEK